MDELQQEQAAFERSFAEVTWTELPAPTAEPSGAVAGVNAPTDSAAAPAGSDASEEAPGAESAAPTGQAAQLEQAADEDDPVLLDGLKRSELRRLFDNAADVGNLKRQLDKAHGNIGDLNRRLQQSQVPAAAQAPATASELSPALRQFEEDYPEVAQYVRALGITPQQRQEAPPADVQQPADAGGAQAAQAGHDPVALELAVMDRVHKGWREKVSSQEFDLWLTTQGEQARGAFDAAQSADDLAAVIGQYDQWATARTAAADKAAKGQQRLQKAVTPSGNAQRPQAAPTEQEAMEAAFKAVLGQ